MPYCVLTGQSRGIPEVLARRYEPPTRSARMLARVEPDKATSAAVALSLCVLERWRRLSAHLRPP
jgi:hypothetical protein